MKKWAILKKKSNVLNIQSYIALSLLNNFLHKIRITSVPPILKSGETITNIIEKVNIFNEFLVFQCNTLENRSKRALLLMNTDNVEHSFHYKRWYNLNNWVVKSKKSHGFDSISVCLIQLCRDSITFPLNFF